jgi:F0F1-type ATP synthase delta subunit
MRAFEIKESTTLAPESTTASIENLLTKTVGNPKAFSIASNGIDALLDATNRMVSLVKSKKQPPSIQPAVAQNTQLLTQSKSHVSEQANPIPAYQQRLKSIEENVKFLRTMTKANKKMLEIVSSLELEMKELKKAIEDALKSAAKSYKSLDPLIKKMLEKTGSNNSTDVAKARELFVNDEIPINDAKTFLEIAQTGVIDMNKLVKKSNGKIDEFVVKNSVVKRVYDKVIDDFINWIPGRTAGNIGPGELMFVMLGNPAGKEKKGDLKVGEGPDEETMYEVKAGSKVQAELKKGGVGIPKRSGAIFDTGISGKAAWPTISKILSDYGFKNLVTDPVEKPDGTVEQYSNYNLVNTNFDNWNSEFDRLKLNLDSRTEILTKVAEVIFPIKGFNFDKVKSNIKKILSTTKGKILPAAVPNGESKSLENDIPLMRYFAELGLQTYRQEGKSKNNFLFFNKTTREFKIFRGDEMDAEIRNPQSDLKVIAGVAFSLTDSQSKAVPRLTLG